jgi:Predicted amidophosphoribosyltransferases
MELAPRYCRSCGSRILVKNVCHNCNNDPLKGDNYCYDCGALTPNADSCTNCGAKYKKNFPVNPLVLGSILVIVIAVVIFLLSRFDKGPSTQEPEKTIAQTPVTPEPNNQESPQTQDTIVNKTIDTSAKIIAKRPTDTAVIKPLPTDTSKPKQTGAFTTAEVKAYNARCSYFAKGQRGQVLFFIAGGSGYIKMNDKIYELKRKSKGVDVEVFSGNNYEATLRIDGLSGSEKEWLASCTLNIKDLTQNTSAKHKVYSSCIEL